MLNRVVLLLVILGVACCALALRPAPTRAVPIFSHQYDVTCEKCHTVIPHLNAFGAAFMASGYRIPGVRPARPSRSRPKRISSTRARTKATGPNGAGLPKAIVDETRGVHRRRDRHAGQLLRRTVRGRRRHAGLDARRLGYRSRLIRGRAASRSTCRAARSRCRCRSIRRRSATPTKATRFTTRPSARTRSTSSIRKSAGVSASVTPARGSTPSSSPARVTIARAGWRRPEPTRWRMCRTL